MTECLQALDDFNQLPKKSQQRFDDLKDKLKNEKKPTWHDYFFSYFASEYYLLDGEGSKFSCCQSS